MNNNNSIPLTSTPPSTFTPPVKVIPTPLLVIASLEMSIANGDGTESYEVQGRPIINMRNTLKVEEFVLSLKKFFGSAAAKQRDGERVTAIVSLEFVGSPSSSGEYTKEQLEALEVCKSFVRTPFLRKS